MTHRPYPNADRARRQLSRHAFEVGPTGVQAAPVGLPGLQEAGRRMQAAFRGLPSTEQLFPVGEYRLSTR